MNSVTVVVKATVCANSVPSVAITLKVISLATVESASNVTVYSWSLTNAKPSCTNWIFQFCSPGSTIFNTAASVVKSKDTSVELTLATRPEILNAIPFATTRYIYAAVAPEDPNNRDGASYTADTFYGVYGAVQSYSDTTGTPTGPGGTKNFTRHALNYTTAEYTVGYPTTPDYSTSTVKYKLPVSKTKKFWCNNDFPIHLKKFRGFFADLETRLTVFSAFLTAFLTVFLTDIFSNVSVLILRNLISIVIINNIYNTFI